MDFDGWLDSHHIIISSRCQCFGTPNPKQNNANQTRLWQKRKTNIEQEWAEWSLIKSGWINVLLHCLYSQNSTCALWVLFIPNCGKRDMLQWALHCSPMCLQCSCAVCHVLWLWLSTEHTQWPMVLWFANYAFVLPDCCVFILFPKPKTIQTHKKCSSSQSKTDQRRDIIVHRHWVGYHKQSHLSCCSAQCW